MYICKKNFIFVIIEIVHMNAGVSFEIKKKVKESQSRSVTPSPNTPSGAGLGASKKLHEATYISPIPTYFFIIIYIKLTSV